MGEGGGGERGGGRRERERLNQPPLPCGNSLISEGYCVSFNRFSTGQFQHKMSSANTEISYLPCVACFERAAA